MHKAILLASAMALLVVASMSQVHAAAIAELKILPSAEGQYVAVVIADQPCKWLILTVDRKTFFFSFPQPTLLEGGRVCLWEGPAGVYGCVADAEDGTRQTTNVVLGGNPTPPNPDPDPPGPDPPPSTFKAQVKAAFDLVTKSREAAPKLGANYRVVAATAAANPSSWDPAAMSDAVKTRHAEVLTTVQMGDWQPFWPQLAKAFIGLKLSATDLPGHVAAFNSVADVLEGTSR